MLGVWNLQKIDFIPEAFQVHEKGTKLTAVFVILRGSYYFIR